MARRRKTRQKINIAESGLGRVFFHWCCVGEVSYHPCISVQDVQVSRTAPTNVYCPSEQEYGQFDIVSEVTGAVDRYTSNLLTHMTLDDVNFFHRLFELDCPIDISIHYGKCSEPSDFYGYEKMLIFKDVRVTDYNLTALVALQAEERQVIDESIGISFQDLLVLMPITELTETRVEDITVNSFSILRDNSCRNCTKCVQCFCANLSLNTEMLQNIITSWQDNGNKLVMVNDNGIVTVISASEYIENQNVKVSNTFSLNLEVGETVDVGSFRSVGTSLGKVFYIDEGRTSQVILNNGGTSAITAIYHKNYDDIIIGDADGNIYCGDPDGVITQLNSPTAVQITAVNICQDVLLVADVLSKLYYSADNGETWEDILYPCDTSNVLSIECCDCTQFLIGTEESLLYSANNLVDFQIIHDDYINYKHIVCCDKTNDFTILAEDGTDSIILSTAMYTTLT